MSNLQKSNKAVTKSNSKIEFRNSNQLALNTKLSYENAVRQLHTYLTVHKLAEDIDGVTAFLKNIQEQQKPGTFNFKRQALKEYLLQKYRNDHRQVFAIEQLFKSQALRPITTNSKVSDNRYLSKENIDFITKALLQENHLPGSRRIALMIQTLFLTGIRVSALVNIRANDIQEEVESVTISTVGKRKKQHDVFIPKGLYEAITSTFQGQQYLFESIEGNQYSRENVTFMIRRKLKRLGFPNTGAHLFRHSHAMYLKEERGFSPEMVQQSLNHARVTTTVESYYHSKPSRKELGSLEPWTIEGF